MLKPELENEGISGAPCSFLTGLISGGVHVGGVSGHLAEKLGAGGLRSPRVFGKPFATVTQPVGAFLGTS